MINIWATFPIIDFEKFGELPVSFVTQVLTTINIWNKEYQYIQKALFKNEVETEDTYFQLGQKENYQFFSLGEYT